MRNRLLSALFLLVCTAHPHARAQSNTTENSEELAFLLVGDQGKGNEGQRVVADSMHRFCQANRCDFTLLLGDNFYNSGVRSVTDKKFKTHFEDMYAKMGIQFWAVLGNHDYGFGWSRGNVQAQVDYTQKSNIWRMPARYYSFESKGVEFIGIDTVALPKDLPQQVWLENKLKEPNRGFRVVFGHYPIHSSGMHGDTDYLRDEISPKLCGNTDVFAAGHDHHLEHLRTECGVELVLSGAGAETRAVTPHPKSVFSAEKLGFAYMKKTSSSSMSIQYYDVDHTLLAHYVLQK